MGPVLLPIISIFLTFQLTQTPQKYRDSNPRLLEPKAGAGAVLTTEFTLNCP